MIAQVDRRNLHCRVLLPDGKETTLAALLPDHWLEGKKNTERIRIDRESEANHDLILGLDKPGGFGRYLYIGKYLF